METVGIVRAMTRFSGKKVTRGLLNNATPGSERVFHPTERGRQSWIVPEQHGVRYQAAILPGVWRDSKLAQKLRKIVQGDRSGMGYAKNE